MKNFKSGNKVSQETYKCFIPSLVNRQWSVQDMGLISMLGKADRELGRLDMYSEYVPDIDLFISMHVLKEATKSSKIEGTKTSIEEAIQEKRNIVEENRADWEEVRNYVRALNSSVRNLKKIPFSTRLIRDGHRTMMKGVRGEHKNPGEFRRSQNWIGGSSIKDASYIPPLHSEVGRLMSDLEKFAHNENIEFPHLLRIALIHYQFETIHPFLDGNGRVGRMMITLYLVDKGILKRPILYLSDYFEKNRMAYYDNLTQVRENHDLKNWFRFFLEGMIETSRSGVNTFDQILKLKSRVEERIRGLGSRSGTALSLMTRFYRTPILNAKQISKYMDITYPTIYSLLDALEDLKILVEMTGGKRDRHYIFKDYVELFH